MKHQTVLIIKYCLENINKLKHIPEIENTTPKINFPNFQDVIWSPSLINSAGLYVSYV